VCPGFPASPHFYREQASLPALPLIGQPTYCNAMLGGSRLKIPPPLQNFSLKKRGYPKSQSELPRVRDFRTMYIIPSALLFILPSLVYLKFRMFFGFIYYWSYHNKAESQTTPSHSWSTQIPPKSCCQTAG